MCPTGSFTCPGLSGNGMSSPASKDCLDIETEPCMAHQAEGWLNTKMMSYKYSYLCIKVGSCETVLSL